MYPGRLWCAILVVDISCLLKPSARSGGCHSRVHLQSNNMVANNILLICATILVCLLIKWLLQPTRSTDAATTEEGPIRVTRIFVHPIKVRNVMHARGSRESVNRL